MKNTTHVGLDAHKEMIHAAVRLPAGEQPLTESFKNSPETIRRFLRRLGKRVPGEILCCHLGERLNPAIRDHLKCGHMKGSS